MNSRRDKTIEAKIFSIRSDIALLEARSPEIVAVVGVENPEPDAVILAKQKQIKYLETLQNKTDDEYILEVTGLLTSWLKNPNPDDRYKLELTNVGLGFDEYMRMMEAQDHAE